MSILTNFKSIRDRRIRLALIGCGRIAGKHFDAIGKLSDQLELVAVCDNQTERLAAAVEQTGAAGYSTLDEVLEAKIADAIVLATPSGLHATQVVAAAQAGCHVITEKPMATRWKDGLRMVEACDRNGVRLFVVKQNRQNATLKMVRQALLQKRLGRIHMVSINVFWTRPQDYYDQDEWRGTWEFDGGALMNQASHYVDLIDWLVGPVESVQAMTGTLARDIEVEDSAVMNIKWRSGTLGSMAVSMLTYPKNLEGSITILGENGSIRVGGVAVNEIQHWEMADERPEDETIKQVNYQTTSVYGFGHHAYYENVISTLRGEAEPDTDGREGLRSLELLIAAYLSARDGSKVSLPLQY